MIRKSLWFLGITATAALLWSGCAPTEERTRTHGRTAQTGPLSTEDCRCGIDKGSRQCQCGHCEGSFTGCSCHTAELVACKCSRKEWSCRCEHCFGNTLHCACQN